MPRAPKTAATTKKPYAKKPSTPKKPNINQGGYDRSVLIQEVAKASTPDFDHIGKAVGKTGTQCKDTWRKTLLPNILSGGQWCISGPGWDMAMKQTMTNEVLKPQNAKPDWEAIATLFPGKTATQTKDAWRKVVMPKLKAGEPIG